MFQSGVQSENSPGFHFDKLLSVASPVEPPLKACGNDGVRQCYRSPLCSKLRGINPKTLNGHTFSVLKRQRHRKDRPFTHLALNSDLPTQENHELLDNGQPQTRASIFLGGRQIPLVKLLEDLIQILLFDPNSGVRVAKKPLCEPPLSFVFLSFLINSNT